MPPIQVLSKAVPRMLVCLGVVTPLLLSQHSNSQSCRGNATTLLYLWKIESEASDSNQTHLLLSEQFGMDCTDLVTEGLSFHTYMRALKDFVDSDSSGLQRIIRVHNLYAQYAPTGWARFRLGRQFLSLGVTRGSVDGATVRLGAPADIRATFFAGLSVSGDSLTLKGWEDGNLLGGQLVTTYLPKTVISGSFVNRSSNGQSIQQKLGLEAKLKPHPGLHPSFGVYYDFSEEELKKLYFGCVSNGLDVASAYANYTYTNLTVPEGFLSEEDSPSGRGRLRVGASYYPQWISALSVVYVAAMYEEESSYHVEFSADKDWGSVGIGHSFGYGGGRTGAFATAFYPLLPNLTISTGVDYAKYRYSSDEDDSENDLATHLGVDVSLARNLKIHGRTEVLQNEEYDYDVRFLTTVSVGFGS